MADLKRTTLDEIKLDEHNARRRTSRSAGALKRSIEKFGLARSIVVDGKNVVRAGNGTLQEALDRGLKKAVIVDAEGDEMIVVRRSDWTEEEAALYAITDNRTSDLSTWDWEIVAETFKESGETPEDLQALGWLDYELAPLLQGEFVPTKGEDSLESFGEDETVKLSIAAEVKDRLDEVKTLIEERAERELDLDEALIILIERYEETELKVILAEENEADGSEEEDEEERVGDPA